MAADGKITPEKQLLNIIQSAPRGSKNGEKPKRFDSWKERLFPFKDLRGSWAGRLAYWKRTVGKNAMPPKSAPDLSWVNRALSAAAVGLALYVFLDTVAAAVHFGQPIKPDVRAERILSGSPESGAVLKEPAYYLQTLQSRDIFKDASDFSRFAAPMGSAAGPKPNEAVQGLSLVGISWSADPDVILEDKTTQKTHFLKTGHRLPNGVKVEAIFKDHVVLSLNGQEFEL